MQYWQSLLRRAAPTGGWPRGASARALGVDVGLASAKLVDVSTTRAGAGRRRHPVAGAAGRRWRLEAAALVPWPGQGAAPGAACIDAEGGVTDIGAVASALKPVVDARGWRGREAVAAMPAAAVTVRRLQVPPALGARDLELEVQLQAEALLPLPLEQSHLDYWVEPDGQVRMAAASRAAVDARCEALGRAGLRVVAVDLASDALRRSARRTLQTRQTEPHAGTDGVCALIDIGLQAARIQLLCGARVLHEREQVGLGAVALRELTLAEAAQALSDALSLFFDGRASALETILLSGAFASRPGLVQAMQLHNLCACELLMPFAGFDYAATVDRTWLHPQAAAFASACGLALHAWSNELPAEASA